MASACVNNIGMSPETFPATTYQSYGWLSPRMSLSCEDDSSKTTTTTKAQADPVEIEDPDSGSSSSSGGSSTDFEFRLEDPVAMLPADQLFSDGKLMPLHLSNMKPSLNEMRSTEIDKSCRRMEMEISGTDPYLFSPKAPRCSSRWRELLGLKKLYQNANAKPEQQQQQHKTSSKSIKHFLHRSGKGPCSSSDPSFSLPLLKDCDSESVSVSSSRLSLSSSSSGHEHEDLPRLSLDSDKTPNPNPSPSPNPFVLNRNPNPPRMRAVKARAENNGNQARDGRSPMRRESTSRGVSVDSPRMNSSGKIVFQSLERSSSSPSSFNGGARFKHRGMERSYSANVRITPVLNVPVCSLRGSSKSGSVFGFGQLFSSSSSSPQKKEATNGVSRGQQSNNNNSSKNRTDRT